MNLSGSILVCSAWLCLGLPCSHSLARVNPASEQDALQPAKFFAPARPLKPKLVMTPESARYHGFAAKMPRASRVRSLTFEVVKIERFALSTNSTAPAVVAAASKTVSGSR